MAIDHSRESFWQSEPDGQTPKSLTVDMKQVHAISRMRVSTPNAAENTPVRSTVLGSHDGVFWFQLAANPGIPRAEPVADAIGAMTQRVFKGDFTGYTQWQQIAQLAKTGKPVAEANATELAWGIPMGEPGAAEPYAALWHGHLVQRKDGALRIVVRGDMVAVAVDGRLELAPSTTAAQRPLFE